MKKSIFIVGIIIVLALITGGAVWYVKNQKYEPVAENGQIPVASEPIVAATSTAEWLTYRNEEYGFEIKYPGDYIFKEIKGGVYLKHPTYDFVPISPAKGGAVSITLANTTIENHIKSIENTDPPLSRVISQKEYVIDGVKGLEIISTFAEGLDYYDIFIKSDNKEYLISYGDIGFDYTKDILSTFKFIK
jgi:hypothetical protein